MNQPQPSFTVGVEEEYLLVDRESRDLVVDPPADLLAECQKRLPGRVGPEFMRSQIEVGTTVCATITDLRAELTALRRTVSDVAQAYGMAIIAASTHPFASWLPQKTTDHSRYNALARDIGTPLRRLLICAMHVHAGIDDVRLRIDMMNQMIYFLPHLLVLSTSSPFWQGQETMLKSYRLAVFDEMPRTGIPESFSTNDEYERHLQMLIDTGVIEDGTKIWWDVRPSARFPTLEMRICDICSNVEDSLMIAALYVCLLRMLWRLKRLNCTWRRYKNMLIEENRWRAMRYGGDRGLIDFGRGTLVPYPDLLAEMVELIAEDAEALNCQAEVGRALTVPQRGTSADRQLAIYNEALASGATERQALVRVVDWLIEETVPVE